jgi:hypothetical protein
MYSVANQAAGMVGNWAMPPERIPMPQTLTRSEEDAARTKLDEYLLETGAKLLASSSVGELGRAKSEQAYRIVGHAYLVAYTFAKQNKDGISRVADELCERRELNGDEITELLDSLHLKPAVVDYLEERTWPRL